MEEAIGGSEAGSTSEAADAAADVCISVFPSSPPPLSLVSFVCDRAHGTTRDGDTR